MNTAQRIVKNTASLLFSGIVSQLIGFVVMVYLARVLGPGDFGKINFAIAIIAYFMLLADFGLPLLGIREIAGDRGKVINYAGDILTMRLCLSFFSFGLLAVMTYFLNKPIEIKYLIVLYGLGLIPSALLLDWAFQGVEKMEYIGIGRILSIGIYLGLIVSFIKSSNQLLFIPPFQVIGNLIAAGLLFSIFIKKFGKPRFRFNVSSWKKVFMQALPIGISIIMIQLIYNIDTVMLGFMRSNAEIGYYNAAYKIILPLIMVGAVYFDAIFPITAKYYKTSLDSLKKLQSYTAKLMVIIALPLAVGGTILSKPIMNLLYGPKYNNGIIAFQILIWAVALIYLNTIYAKGMWACNKQGVFLKIVSAQAIVNILLNFILIPELGIVGSAISTVSSELFGFPFYYWQFNKVVNVPIHNYIVRPLFAATIMGVFLKFLVNLNIFFLMFGGIFIYAIFLYFIKGITRNDLRLIQDALYRKLWNL